MRDVQGNRQLMERVFEGLARGDGSAFVESMSDDFTWVITGTTAWSGTYRGKREVRERLLGPLMAQLENYRNRPLSMTAEDDRVVVECRGESVTRSGERYDNAYCWVCQIQDGRLTRLTEYMDTELVTRALAPPPAA